MSDNSVKGKKYLDELLKRLEEKKIEVPSRTEIQGRAIGKSQNGIFLSTRTGLVEIPISEIESVSPLSHLNQDIVSVVVRDFNKIEYKVRTISQAGPGGGGGGGGGGSTTDTYTEEYEDSATMTTLTPPFLDATDDTEWIKKVDDHSI
jgi:hypothetical protein